MDDKNTVIKGVSLKCKHCGENKFLQRKAHLNTSIMSAIGLDFLDPSSDVFVCRNCGFLHWFLNPDISEPIKCLSCGTIISEDEGNCSSCGWSYLTGETENIEEKE